MKILLTSTSFIDTPGIHQKKLDETGFEIDKLRGPLTEEELLNVIYKYDAVICGDDEITEKVLSEGVNSKLKIISKYGIGLDKINIEAAKKLSIPVYNTPGVNHVTVAEHIIALIFTYFKNIHLEHNITKQGRWKRLIGHELNGKKVGILGFGRIGKELAVRLSALGMNCKVFDPKLDHSFIKKNNFNVANNLTELVSEIDILCLTLPLNKNTKGIINFDLISNTKNKIVLVNTSRALIVNQECLIKLLEKNKIKAYLTDVLEKEPMINNHPLLEFDNVIITPHIGSRTYESVQRQGLKAVENLIDGLKEYLK